MEEGKGTIAIELKKRPSYARNTNLCPIHGRMIGSEGLYILKGKGVISLTNEYESITVQLDMFDAALRDLWSKVDELADRKAVEMVMVEVVIDNLVKLSEYQSTKVLQTSGCYLIVMGTN